jgi:hypothetical protein
MQSIKGMTDAELDVAARGRAPGFNVLAGL